MKFLNYLNEESQEEIIDLISEHCKPYLKKLKKINFSKGKLLLSGRKNNYSGGFALKNIRKNRVPRDTKKDIHNYIDKEFEKKFGIKARSQTIFCFNDIVGTGNYGTPYYVFPIGDFEVIWSKEWLDLYNTRPYMDQGLERYKEFFKESVLPTYVKGDLLKALNTDNEIMVYCKSFKCYMLRYNYDSIEQILDYFSRKGN